jgi:prepilin-type processing-associated H-X9-DG protein
MHCPHCDAQADESALECSSCRGDLGVTLTDASGATYGPYTVAQLRQYVESGHVPPQAMASQGPHEPVPVHRLLAESGEPAVTSAGPAAPAPPLPGQPPAAPPQMVAPPKPRKASNPWLVGGIIFGVIAILVVPLLLMAAVMFPVFARAREKARQASCLSNMKQISLAMLMYSQDHDQRFPTAGAWHDKVFPYMRNEEIFNCPSTDLGRGSYEYNEAALDGREVGTIPQPQTSILLLEAGYGVNQEGPHNGGWNLAFTDGHCKWARQGPGPSSQMKF